MFRPSPQPLLEKGFVLGENGILVDSNRSVVHQDDEYDPEGFFTLRNIQSRHFWYKGRHRFLLAAVRRALGSNRVGSAIDLGGGCGGWLSYLRTAAPTLFGELALADSSVRALSFAEQVVGPEVKRYQVSLSELPWRNRWDAAFLLDVLEHLPDDVGALRQAAKALRPGGYLFVTIPALQAFWSYNDDLVHHLRRYDRSDCKNLALKSGLELVSTRYFMFFLSPLLFLSRWRSPKTRKMSPTQLRQLVAKTHRVPSWPINKTLEMVFSLEAPIGIWLPFPWGTSILAVFQKR